MDTLEGGHEEFEDDLFDTPDFEPILSGPAKIVLVLMIIVGAIWISPFTLTGEFPFIARETEVLNVRGNASCGNIPSGTRFEGNGQTIACIDGLYFYLGPQVVIR